MCESLLDTVVMMTHKDRVETDGTGRCVWDKADLGSLSAHLPPEARYHLHPPLGDSSLVRKLQ